MKKIFIYIALLATAYCAQAQFDTLNIGDREPTFYYWDTNWWDHYYLNYPEARADSCMWYDFSTGGGGLSPEVARYCYTDTSLRIIGIAAAVRFGTGIGYSETFDHDTVQDVFKYLQPEYFNLYEVDPATNDLVLLTGKSWNNTTPRYLMVTREENNYEILADTVIRIPPEYEPVYEVYFDSAITVHDSFYVSMTHNTLGPLAFSNVTICAHIYSNDPATYSRYGTNVYYEPKLSPKPNHFRRKLHRMPTYEWQDERYGAMDTAWHTYGKTRYINPNTTAYIKEWDFPGFIYIFPIIDTTGLYLRQPCNTTTGFRNVSIDSCTVAMEWNPDGSSERYEVAVSRIGRTPEEGTVVQCDTNYAVVRTEPWDTTAQWYSAWVRCICAAGHRSEWSSPVTFNVHCSPGAGPEDPVGISVAVDRASRLQPNPASGSVRVESSYRIAEVELFSLDGRSLQRRAVDATGTTLDISQLPSGTYIVRIATTSGTAYKKLVVK